jgi:CheY-like chemotaxis protein
MLLSMKTIYLTDDDEDDRMFLRYAIEKAVRNVCVVELDSGDKLINLMSSESLSEDASVIIIDMNMPRMNGLETLRALMTNQALRHIPVVMLSTSADSKLIRHAYQAGVNAFLEKPITESDFMRMAQAIDVCFLNTSRPAALSNSKAENYPGSVIVIEDNEDHLFFIRRALNDNMSEVHVVELPGSCKAVQELRTRWDDMIPAPKLILIDLYLPDRQTGLDTLVGVHQVLAERNARSVPVIVFTFSDRTEDMKASYAHNASGYLTKDADALNWKNDLKNLENFWWDTVSHS